MAAAAQHVDAYWMPFTANRDFKKNPRIITGAEGHYYKTADGRTIYDLAVRRSLIVIGEEMVNIAFDSRVDASPESQIQEAEGQL